MLNISFMVVDFCFSVHVFLSEILKGLASEKASKQRAPSNGSDLVFDPYPHGNGIDQRDLIASLAGLRAGGRCSLVILIPLDEACHVRYNKENVLNAE